MTANNGRTIGRVVALVIPVGVFFSLAACTIDDGPTGLEISQDQWLDTGGACTLPTTATTEQRVQGVLDVAVLGKDYTHYLLYPFVKNLLAPFSGLVGIAGAPVEEKNNILLKSFHVKLDVATGAGSGFAWDPGCPGEFDVPLATSEIAPGGTVAAATEIIRPCNAAPLFRYLQAFANNGQIYPTITVNTTTRAHGTLGSSGIDSPPFKYPVNVCYGCLQAGYSDATAAQFNFPLIAKCSDLTSNPYNGDPCNPAQDYPVLCCASAFDDNGDATTIQCPGIPTGSAK